MTKSLFSLFTRNKRCWMGVICTLHLFNRHAVHVLLPNWIFDLAKMNLVMLCNRSPCNTVLKIWCTCPAHVYLQFTTFAHTQQHHHQWMSAVVRAYYNTPLSQSTSDALFISSSSQASSVINLDYICMGTVCYLAYCNAIFGLFGYCSVWEAIWN